MGQIRVNLPAGSYCELPTSTGGMLAGAYLACASTQPRGWAVPRRTRSAGRSRSSSTPRGSIGCVDWIAFASVVSSGTVALATLVVNAATKRGDRQHAAALDYEKRVWEAKSAALIEVIGACEAIIAALRFVETASEPLKTLVERGKLWRAYAFEAILDHQDDLTGNASAALAAYSSEPLRAAMGDLRALTDAVLSHGGSYEFARKEIELKRTAALERQDMVEVVDAWREGEKQAAELSQRLRFERDELRELCERVIEAARQDLRGPVGK